MRKNVQLSGQLYAHAAQAASAECSPAEHIERWANLGRVLESRVAQGIAVEPDPKKNVHPGSLEILGTLEALAHSEVRPTVVHHLKLLVESGVPLFEVDPQNPDGLVRVGPKGRWRGHFVDGEFVPIEPVEPAL
jgi:hypothetical protein